MSTIYINTPFEAGEYAAIAALAKAQGRSKGKQLREMALAVLATHAAKKPATTAETVLNVIPHPHHP